MSIFSELELNEAHRALLSTLKKCEKVQGNAALGKSQTTLLERRIAAIKVALALIEKELDDGQRKVHDQIKAYNDKQSAEYAAACDRLREVIDRELRESESKIWHAHPVWFLDGNPIVGYSIQKPGVRLMFWSGADFEEDALNVVGKKFKDASIFYSSVDEIDVKALKRWLKKAREIQWDYKNLIKRKGKLGRLK
ncbi:MAG TPA: DUF1801 domain-containing protein [Pyrinomonadaceae bacterium]|nr:DUF1801 domain-containing protein [Pyrinomonadaceae bacterium]